MKTKYIILPLVGALLSSLASSCADDTFADGGNGGIIIEIALPQSQAVAESRAEMTPDADECRINDLRLLAFPQGKGTFANIQLPTPQKGAVKVEANVSELRPGNYHLYVVANLASEVASVKTEDELKAVMLDFGTASKPALPKAGNLPMVYEPASTTTVGATPARLTASLSFACAKVALNLIFDKQNCPECAAAFANSAMRVSEVKIVNASTKTTMLNLKKTSADAYTTAIAGGKHYKSYNRNDANASIDNKDVVSAFAGEFTPSKSTDSWCYHTVVYLPERYVSDASKGTSLEIAGDVYAQDGSTIGSNIYTVNLGSKENGVANIKRDTYYEIVADVKSFGLLSLDRVGIKATPWGQSAIDASMLNTLLSVDKTKVSVTTLEPEVISYESTADEVTFECQTPYIQGLPIIIAEQDAENGTFTLRINPAISMADLAPEEQTGNVVIMIQANNIIKYIDVQYDIQPFFDVDYRDHIIIWGEQLTKIARVTTNLGTIRYQWSLPHSLTKGTASVKITQEKVADGIWDIKMTLEADPVASTVLEYEIGPESSYYYNEFATPMTVTVKPQPDKYRIYMRAINDRFNGTYPGDGTLASILTEYDVAGAADNSNNWRDGWSHDDKINPSRHCLYLYYQYGESGGTDEIPVENVWTFSSAFPGDKMTADTQNPGWYYKDYPTTAKGHNAYGKPDKLIIPGEALLIFSSNEDVGHGYTRHRFPHHMDPGITLFNLEDLEGWYLYDPTSDPYYRIYDEKPTVVDVTYTVYYKGQITGWEHQYGVAGENVSSRYTIKSSTIDRTSAGNGWYKHTFTLKAPKGEYEKAINMIISGSSQRPVLFGGNSWTTGYYDGKWHNGKPADANN